MAEVKGILVTAMRAFLLDRYGKAAYDQALASLNPNDVAFIKKTFLDSSFYPYATMTALAALTHALNPIRKTSGQELGTFLAESIFKGPYKPLLAKDVALMVPKIAFIKDFFYRDANNVESSMTGDKACSVIYRYENGVRPTRGVCRSLGAFWGRTLELAGGVKVAGTHTTCIAEGRDRCDFRYAW